MPRLDHILTCAEGLSWEALAPFVRSARAYAPDARLVIFASRLSEECRAACRLHGAQLLPLDALFPNVPGRTEAVRGFLWRVVTLLSRILRYPDFRRRLLQRGGGLLLPRNQARFFHFLAYLEDCAVPGDRFLFCDARDVVLQADPFARMPDQGVALTEEESDVTLSSNSYNARWYRETYGDTLFRLHAGKSIVCAGVFGGERNALIDLLNRLVEESSRRGHAYGADQAILNHLYYSGAAGSSAHPNRGSFAWHLYGVPENLIRLDESGLIRQADGHLPAIVHMYDRHPFLDQAVRGRWGK